MLSKTKCYRCGKSGHHPTNCKFKNATCYSCQKTGHLASVCLSKKPHTKPDRPHASSKTQEDPTKPQEVCILHENSDSSSDSSEHGHLHTILQLGTNSNKFVITVKINEVPVEMEVDSGAERSTIQLTIFQRKLSDMCQLQPSAVSLQQYDKIPLTISGECQVPQLKLMMVSDGQKEARWHSGRIFSGSKFVSWTRLYATSEKSGGLHLAQSGLMAG